MRLFMDRHFAPEMTPEESAAVHLRDLEFQDKYGVNFITYWMWGGVINCLAAGPSRQAVQAVHAEAHGGVPSEVIEVSYGSLEEIFGPLHPPGLGEVWEASAVRTMLISQIAEPEALIKRLDDDGMLAIVREHEFVVRESVESRGGVYLRRGSDASIGSFASVVGAVRCALAIHQTFREHTSRNRYGPIRLRIGMSAGEPVTDRGELFGAVLELGAAACKLAQPGQILVTSVVRDLCLGKGLKFGRRQVSVHPETGESTAVYEVMRDDPPQLAVAAASTGGALPDSLSRREVEVLRLIADGRTNQEIASTLVISLNTVLRHVSNIFSKANVANRAGAASYAHRHRLI